MEVYDEGQWNDREKGKKRSLKKEQIAEYPVMSAPASKKGP